jgi:anaerobic dimethyl sulfoxide reductase subunit A
VREIPTFCGKDCGGNACPLMAHVEGGRVVKVTNNPAAGPFLKGCRRGFALPEEASAPGRLLTPLIRDGDRGSGRFREAGWDEALGMVAQRLGAIQGAHGAGSVLCLGSAGCTSALHATHRVLARFLNVLGGATTLTGSYSSGAANLVLPYLLGPAWEDSGFDPATMESARMIILWGANVLEARLGTEVDARLEQARRRGAQVVVVDPRRSGTARRTGAWWIPVRPGTDAALMLAVLFVLLSEGLADRPFLSARSQGFDRLEGYVLGTDGGQARTPRWAQGICGLPAEEITRFARAYAAARPAMLLPGYSIQRVFAGEETYRLAVALQLATGNFGVKGGSTGSMNNRLSHPRVGTLPVPRAAAAPRVTMLRWPDAVLEGTRGGYQSDIRALYSVGGNFLNQGSDVARNVRAFQAVQFSVCHDIFLTPTARHCDVVLPAAHALEKEDIGIPWLGNFLTYKRAAAAPPGLARTDYDILCDLADRMGVGPQFSEGRSEADWLRLFLDQSEVPDHDRFRETGVYLAPEQERVGLAEFSADPGRYPLPTPSGKVEIASQRYARDTGFPEIPTWQDPPSDARFPLLLITPKSPHRTHSQGSAVPQIRARAAHALEMNPGDAAARGVSDGERVIVFNLQGETAVSLRLSQDISPGVVCLPEGVWVEPGPDGRDTAGSANMLTSTKGTSPGTCCIMHGVGVQVRGAGSSAEGAPRRGEGGSP